MFWGLVFVYIGGVIWEVAGKQRDVAEALWWPLRSARKILTFIGKKAPDLKDETDALKEQLDEIHEKQ